MRPSAAAIAASTTDATTPASVPSSETAPDVPGVTRRQPTTSHVVLPQALPTSLAIVSLDAVTSAATIARRGRSARAMPRQMSAAQAAMPVFAIALPGPRRPPRSSAIPTSALRLNPRRVARATLTNETMSSVQPCQPPPR